MTLSTLALESDSRVLKRPWILEKSLAFDARTSPSTSVYILLGGDHDSRPGLQAVPRFSVMVCRLSIRCPGR